MYVYACVCVMCTYIRTNHNHMNTTHIPWKIMASLVTMADLHLHTMWWCNIQPNKNNTTFSKTIEWKTQTSWPFTHVELLLNLKSMLDNAFITKLSSTEQVHYKCLLYTLHTFHSKVKLCIWHWYIQLYLPFTANLNLWAIKQSITSDGATWLQNFWNTTSFSSYNNMYMYICMYLNFVFTIVH